MKLLDVITVEIGTRIRRIELLQGDLSQIPDEHAVDLLIVSAFPDDYIPTPSSLIGSLNKSGLSVGHLSRDKHVDLRSSCSCWLSSPVGSAQSRFNFERILCFEPAVRGEPTEVIGDIFRAITPFTGGHPPLDSIAMPILAAGDQGYPISSVLPPLIDAAYHWLSIGLPLDVIKIVAYSDSDAANAKIEFASSKLKFRERIKNEKAPTKFDVFVSYCRENRPAGIAVRDELQLVGLDVFFDEQSIDTGASWQQKIFEALDSCSRMVAVYSPAYIKSKVCQEEFNIAWARSRQADESIIFPIYWESCELPTHMTLLNYLDCREQNPAKIRRACRPLIELLKR